MDALTQLEIMALKGYISELPQRSQEKIKATTVEITRIIKEAGDEGLVAFALVAAEVSK